MKRLLYFIAIVLIQFKGSAQTINDIPLKTIDVEYVEIVGETKAFSSKLTIQLDFGQKNKLWGNKEYDLKGEDGKKLEFNSMIDALNFMTKNGFEFVQAYAITISTQNFYHYLLRKRKAS